jgi:WD40 repeat protein
MAHTASTIAMQLVAMLGVRPNVSGAVAYLDDGEIQYVSGRNLVRYDIESRAQRILQGTPELAGISAVATSGNRKLSAYAECAPDAAPVIVVYEWSTRRRKRTITGLDCGSAPVTHLAFTADCKHLVVQTGAPEWTLYYIALERGATARVLATHRNVAPSNKTISSVDCHPTDSTLIALTGRGFFKLLRLADDALKPIQVNLRRDPTHFTCHAWLPDDRLVLGAMNGELWLLEGGEFKRVIADAGAAALSAGSGGGLPASAGGSSVPTGATKPVSALLPFSKGFLAGCDGGLIKVLERSEDPRSQYKHTKTFAIGSDDTSCVVGLSLSPNDDDVAIMTAAGQVHGFKLSSHELYKPGDVLFRPLISPFHTHPAHLAALASGSTVTTAPEPEAALEAPPPASASTLRRSSLVGGLPASAPGGGAALSAAAAAANAAALDPLSQPNYGLTGIDVCVRKSTFITSAADRTVRVWNYAPHQGSDGMAGGGGSGGRFGGGKDGVDGASAGITATPALELVQRFPETPGCVSLHPSGFHALVGFESSLQLMNVLMDGLRAFKEFPIRNCGEAHFSYTGGMFGAVNGNTISVFGTYTCAPIVSLRAHADKVVAFAWSRDDRFIVSVSRDGVVIRHAVVVPNATSSSGSGSVPPSAGTVGLGGLTGAPSSAGGERPALVAGKAVNSYELKDLTPLAISTGANESGREVLISGILSRGGVARPVMRLVDMAASMAKDAVKADVNLGSQVVRGIECAVPSRILLAGMGASVERARPAASGPSLQPSASSAAADAPRLQERSRTVGGVMFAPGSTAGGSGAADDSSPLGGLHGSAILAATVGGSSGPAPAESSAAAPAAGLLAPDSAGSLRAYRLPPAADYVELVCHAGPVTRMAMLPNSRALITVGGDGSIALVAVNDLRPKSTGPTGGAGGSLALSSAGVGAGGASSLMEDGLPFADEILVTRADLEEVRKEKSDLEVRKDRGGRLAPALSAGMEV